MAAIGLVHAARQTGLPRPWGLAVVGFDGILFASHLHPPLSTVVQPRTEDSRQATHGMLPLMTTREDSDEELASTMVQGKLIVRASPPGR